MHNIYNAEVDNSTLNDVITEGVNRWRRLLSLATLVVLLLVVSAGLTHLFELEGTAQTSNDDGTIQATYPVVSQAGNEIELRVLLSSAGQLPETVKLELNREYLMLFEDVAIFPEPDSQTSDETGNLEFEIATQPGTTATQVLFTGRASDQWEPRVTGRLRVSWDGAGPYEFELNSWRIP